MLNGNENPRSTESKREPSTCLEKRVCLGVRQDFESGTPYNSSKTETDFKSERAMNKRAA
jgi:hypothetical protein